MNVVIAVNEDRRLVNWTLLAGNVPESKDMPRLLEGTAPRWWWLTAFTTITRSGGCWIIGESRGNPQPPSAH